MVKAKKVKEKQKIKEKLATLTKQTVCTWEGSWIESNFLKVVDYEQ